MDEVISSTELNSKAQLFKWALGFWQSRERYKTQESHFLQLKNSVSEKFQ
jgi:hypothetical protein